MFLEPIIPCFTQPHSPQLSQHTNSCCIKKSEPSKCLFIFSHIETYIKYLPHVEEISEAEFMVTALNASKRGAARSLGGEDDAQLLSFSKQARLGSAGLEAGGLSAACLTIALICQNTKKKKKCRKEQQKKKTTVVHVEPAASGIISTVGAAPAPTGPV